MPYDSSILNIELSLKSKIQVLRRKRLPQLFREFYAFVEDNLDEICNTVSHRWIISILDTIVDYCPDDRGFTALIGVTLGNAEKVAATARYMSDTSLKPVRRVDSQVPIFSGMALFVSGPKADMHRNYLRRLMARATPLEGRLIARLLEIQLVTSGTSLHTINSLHDRDLYVDIVAPLKDKFSERS